MSHFSEQAAIDTLIKDLKKNFFSNRSKRYSALLLFSDIAKSTLKSVEDPKSYVLNCFTHIILAQDKFVEDLKYKFVKSVGDEVMLVKKVDIKDTMSEKEKDLQIASEIIETIRTVEAFMNLANSHGFSTRVTLNICNNVYDYEDLTSYITKSSSKDNHANQNNQKLIPVHDGDIFGKEVNLAARIMALAKENQFVVTQKIKDLIQKRLKCRNSVFEYKDSRFVFGPMVTIALRGFEDKKHVSDLVQIKYESTNQTPPENFEDSTFPLYNLIVINVDFKSIADGRNRRNLKQQLIKGLERVFNQVLLIAEGGISNDQRNAHFISAIVRSESYEKFSVKMSRFRTEYKSQIEASYSYNFNTDGKKIFIDDQINEIENGAIFLICSRGHDTISKLKNEIFTQEHLCSKILKTQTKNVSVVLCERLQGYYDNIVILKYNATRTENTNSAENSIALTIRGYLHQEHLLRNTRSSDDNSFHEWDVKLIRGQSLK